MIHIQVRVFATLRKYLPAEFTLKIKKGTEIGKLFNLIFNRFPEAKESITSETEKDLYSRYILLKNGRNIVHLEKKKTILEKGDTISIFPPIGGGQLPTVSSF
ncbi:MAG: MoaD/ThiS family protein [Candidatus Korarchaeota archaeon]|nr:MoaD/ThiS family protein [Candidatus Korarchaeota archaeon]NIU84133.1 MoaD family protein [Candidatus Thorarchaeota archaeon]NIW14278.1 MoaD family protein [Candidatus Thorarchaeota archaeon]NIW52375.1 MoaD family protein [Candidatus Korarchaeota archaeon]